MSGIPGNLAIIISICLAVISAGAFWISATGKKNLFSLGRKAYYLQLGLIGFSMIWLWKLFFSNDFTIKYVYEYSSTNLPFFYKLSALWAGQDGTYLLWLFLSLAFGLVIIKKAGHFTSIAMVIHTIVNSFLYIMLLTLSPFRQLERVVVDGSGLNPLLQDPWMVIHPPIVFIGFAMAGIVFSIIGAGMIKRDFKNWIKITFPYIAFTGLALAMANVLGGYWAYKTLGWGGYWAWDPVENTSFIPWITALAAIHGMLIEKKNGALRRVNILLAISPFLLSIYGTFLTRSGVLADFSVHSFVDLGANSVLISFVTFYAVFSLILAIYSFRGQGGKPMNYHPLSRSFILFSGMVLLSALAIIVLLLSSWPFITTYFLDNPAAAEISAYNNFAFPLAILIALFITLVPFVKKGDVDSELPKSALPISIIVAVVVSGLMYVMDLLDFTITATMAIYLFAFVYYIIVGKNTRSLLISFVTGLASVVIAIIMNVRDISYLFFIFAASAAISAHLTFLTRLLPGNMKGAGGPLSHLGYGLMLLGILSSSVFSKSELLILPRGVDVDLNEISFNYNGMANTIETENNEILLALTQNDNTIEARPHYFFTPKMNGIMRRPHIEKGLFYDLYLSPQEVQDLPHGDQGLVLKKGDSQTIGDYKISFKSFDVGSHMSDGSSVMSVGVKLEIEKDGQIEEVTPALIHHAGGSTESSAIPMFSDGAYNIKVEKIDADNGAAMLSIPGLIESGPKDRLILDVSYKPGINLLWLGTIIVFLGMGLSIYRRLSLREM